MNENEPTASYDLDRPRPIELAMLIHDENRGLSMRRAIRKKRTACDGLFIVQVFRDDDRLSFMTSSYDGHTAETLSTKELFHMWISLAGHILRNNATEQDAEAMKQKRFILAVLTQLKLSEKLERRDENAPKPEMPVGVSSPALASVEQAATSVVDAVVNENAASIAEIRQAYRTLPDAVEATSTGQDRRASADAPSFETVDPGDVNPGDSN